MERRARTRHTAGSSVPPREKAHRCLDVAWISQPAACAPAARVRAPQRIRTHRRYTERQRSTTGSHTYTVSKLETQAELTVQVPVGTQVQRQKKTDVLNTVRQTASSSSLHRFTLSRPPPKDGTRPTHTLGSAVGFPQPSHLTVHCTQKPSESNIWPNVRAPCGPVEWTLGTLQKELWGSGGETRVWVLGLLCDTGPVCLSWGLGVLDKDMSSGSP